METRARGGALRSLAVAMPLAGALLAGCSGDSDGDGDTADPPAATATTAPAATATATAARTGTPVPPPADTGSPQVATTTLPAVPVGSPAPIAAGVLVSVDGVRTLTVPAAGPGETAGSAVAFAVRVRNDSAQPVDVGGFTVTAGYGSGTPALPSSAKPAAPLTGRLAAGAEATGTYVFRMPAAQVGSLAVQVASAASPTVVVVRVR